MPVTSDSPAPYAPPATILDVIARFRDHGMQVPFTQAVLSRAGVNDSLLSRTLQSLRVLDLIDETGNPTGTFASLAEAEQDKLPERLAVWARTEYADVFQFCNPATDDLNRVRDAFRSYSPRGQQARMVTLFMGLCQAAGIVSASKDTDTPARARPRQRRTTPQRSRTHRGQPDPPGNQNLPEPIAGLLASLPTTRRWSKERRDNFLKTFEAVLDFCVEIGDETEQGGRT